MSTNDETSAERLARYVRNRRAELDVNQLEVWQAGGPSNTTLTTIENGRLADLNRTTARKLDAGLRWEPGSARAVWDGGVPTPRGAQLDERAELRNRILTSPSLSADEKAELLAVLGTPAAVREVGGHDRPAAM